MSELTNIHARSVKDLTTPTELPVDTDALDQVKLVAGNFPAEYAGNEAMTVGMIKDLAAQGREAELEEVLQKITQEETRAKEVERLLIQNKAEKTYVDQELDLKAPQSTTYTKSEVDSALSTKAPQATTYSKTEVDTKFSAYVGGRKAYTTLALAQAAQSSLPANTAIEVTNDGANNGTYQWNGTTLTKSVYDPLTQAKNYTEQYFNEKTVENLYKPTRVIINYYTSQVNGTLQPYSGALVAVIPVIAGQEYFIKCADFDRAFSVSLNEYDYYTTTTLGIVTLTETEYPNVKKFTVPVGSNAKFMYINTYLSAQNYDIRDSLAVGTVPVISEINGFEIVDLQARSSTVPLTSSQNIYDSSTMIVNDFYLDNNHTIDGQTGWKIASIPVTPGNRIKIVCDNYAYPFKAAFFSNNVYSVGKTTVSKVLETDGLAYYGTVPLNAKFLVVSVYITLGSIFDITESLVVTSIPTQSAIEVTSINNMPIADLYARSMLSSSGRFTGKKVFAFGDSITEGTQGGYVKYLSEVFGTTVANYGSSGARTSRVVDIVTAGAGLPKRDPSTANIVWPTKDYTDLVCATLMIGTNDLSGMPMGSLADIPTSNLTDHANPLEYWALFANTYIGNIALVIEFIKSKAPKTEIHIVAPIYGYSASLGPELTQSLIPHLEAVTRYYGVHLIYGTYESGLSYKLMNPSATNPYSYDGVHLNVLGNEVFGKFLAQKVLSFG